MRVITDNNIGFGNLITNVSSNTNFNFNMGFKLEYTENIIYDKDKDKYFIITKFKPLGDILDIIVTYENEDLQLIGPFEIEDNKVYFDLSKDIDVKKASVIIKYLADYKNEITEFGIVVEYNKPITFNEKFNMNQIDLEREPIGDIIEIVLTTEDNSETIFFDAETFVDGKKLLFFLDIVPGDFKANVKYLAKLNKDKE